MMMSMISRQIRIVTFIPHDVCIEIFYIHVGNISTSKWGHMKVQKYNSNSIQNLLLSPANSSKIRVLLTDPVILH